MGYAGCFTTFGCCDHFDRPQKVIDYKYAQIKSNRLQKEDREQNTLSAKKITIKVEDTPPDGGAIARYAVRRRVLKAANTNRIHTGSRIADRRIPSMVHISTRISARKAIQI